MYNYLSIALSIAYSNLSVTSKSKLLLNLYWQIILTNHIDKSYHCCLQLDHSRYLFEHECKHWRIQTGLFIKQISWGYRTFSIDMQCCLSESAIYDNPMTEITFSRFITRYNAITIYQFKDVWLDDMNWTMLHNIELDAYR